MPSHYKYHIGITMGCPVGVGPEIIIKFIKEYNYHSEYFPIIIGIPALFEKLARQFGGDFEVVTWRPGDQVSPGKMYVCCPDQLTDISGGDLESLTWGRPDRFTGKAMALCVEHCVTLIQKGILDAIVTCPITKAALQEAGYHFPGHTEMLAHLCGANQYAMMMAGEKLKVTLVTIHEALSKVPALINTEKIFKLIEITYLSLKNDFGISNPRLAVAGLNPHAGEGGIFGNEEETIIKPAIAMAAESGWLVDGPFPPDTVFNKAYNGVYDVVICMYHDQGLIPFKLVHFEDGVNVTIGLPIVRTSVDHGTAYDIAGSGIASFSSLAAAYDTAAKIAGNRKRKNDE